jgi:SNF2 family DNA or RNA helicase
VEVLAQLAGRAKRHGPSLVIAPRSVLSNWQEEAARFVPSLSVVVHAGPNRARDTASLTRAGLTITSHATLVRDLKLLSCIEFDYVVMDEAQAIKNASTSTARAVRALHARNRIALTGTPIENHLGELWSVLEFTNPGLGSRLPYADSSAPDAETVALLRGMLKPFLLRRTKRQVARDLPERIEQTLAVELDGWERLQYTELLDHYQAKVSQALARFGLQRSTPQVLEALLRLRQAACHAGLIDETYQDAISSKMAVLIERLSSIRDQRQKALVFSQFTGHLDLVEHRLRKERFRCVRLDGQTRHRTERVRCFQEDEGVTVFLISLKAGGTGLNLTAAEYVFLLDPWWNPAAEAQAIDRAHRIGQTKNVVAYRLIAKGTIEEKVCLLQARKRALAESILGDDSAFVGRLTRDDLLQLFAHEQASRAL